MLIQKPLPKQLNLKRRKASPPDAPPLTGSYALGVEPWTSRLNLEDALTAGEAIELEPGSSFTTRFAAIVTC